MQLYTKFEGNTLLDGEAKPIRRNGMLTDFTIFKCQKNLQNKFHT